MNDLEMESKFTEVQVARIKAARLDMEYKIMQRYEEIKRLERDIEIQKEAEIALQKGSK